MKILFGTQGRRLLRGENKPTLTPIRRLGPTVVVFYPMIITRLMTRIGRNTLWVHVSSSSASSMQLIRVVPITATTSTLHPLHTSRNILCSIHFIDTRGGGSRSIVLRPRSPGLTSPFASRFALEKWDRTLGMSPNTGWAYPNVADNRQMICNLGLKSAISEKDTGSKPTHKA